MNREQRPLLHLGSRFNSSWRWGPTFHLVMQIHSIPNILLFMNKVPTGHRLWTDLPWLDQVAGLEWGRMCVWGNVAKETPIETGAQCEAGGTLELTIDVLRTATLTSWVWLSDELTFSVLRTAAITLGCERNRIINQWCEEPWHLTLAFEIPWCELMESDRVALAEGGGGEMFQRSLVE